MLTCALGSFSGRFLGVNFVASLCLVLVPCTLLGSETETSLPIEAFGVLSFAFGTLEFVPFVFQVFPRKWQENTFSASKMSHRDALLTQFFLELS